MDDDPQILFRVVLSNVLLGIGWNLYFVLPACLELFVLMDSSHDDVWPVLSTEQFWRI